MHYLAVLSFMSLWMRVLILSPQLLVRSCSVPFVANSMSMMIRMQTMHPSSISVMSVGATLALVMLLLVWQPMSLQNTTWVHVIPCWWSHSSCNAYQMCSMIFQTVRWLVSCTWHGPVIHSFVWHTVQGYLLLHATILMEWTKLWSPKVVDSVSFSSKSSMWHLWLATLVSKNWLMHYSKGFGGPSCVRQWLPLFIHARLVHKQKTVLQSHLVYCSPFQSQNLASLHGALILPLIYHSLMDVTQFSLVWITSQNTQFSFLVRWVIRHWLQLRQCSCSLHILVRCFGVP